MLYTCTYILFIYKYITISNHYITRTPKATTRTLCECELYAPASYDSDPQMKEVMDNFNKQTQQRFHEYDERMKTTRQKCREKCDKEIQKIILKDKLEKQMVEQFSTLQTDIQSDSIPTCICEKSLEDKMEKGCLRCGGVLGGGIAPTFGLIGSVAINMWKTTEIAAATQEAIAKGLALGKIAGDIEGAAKVVELVKSTFGVSTLDGRSLVSYFTTTPFNKVSIITEALFNEYFDICLPSFTGLVPVHGVRYNSSSPICTFVNKGMAAKKVGTVFSPKNFIKTIVEEAVAGAEQAAETEAARVTATEKLAIETVEKEAIEAASYNLYSAIGYSVIAILIIVLILVIIYLILRYRRKKKMKKKLQYIKLLEE
ncbi:hypothetical protein PFBG_04127 [Plasmodium falciparum 7G8]|uniref:Rifin n=1 Tax=Plasmodium falciparum (isolate 7G8) TaxID=57266 RepID=W7FAY2_PLAF8|nr:hypothetical protein PFBG_04127 [Plasmodium falciparum 7G8]